MQKYPILQNELHRPLNFLRDDVEFNETTKSVLERINIKWAILQIDNTNVSKRIPTHCVLN